MDQSVARLTRETILRLNRERHEEMAKKDPIHKPPRGFYAWQGSLRVLRTVLNWQAAQDNRDSPWPDPRALRMKAPAPRELPVELEGIEGRKKLIEGLKAIDTKTARACMFIAYTGLRRREGTQLKRTDMLTENVLEFKSKTRSLRVPLSKQALALLDLESEGPMLRVTEFQLRKPLIRIFGERKTSRGKKACITPHDLRRYFKSVGTELGIDPTIMDLLVGHAIKGVNKSYIAKLRRSVLLAATQKIADEIDNPQEPADDDIIVPAKQVA
jgi:integrase